MKLEVFANQSYCFLGTQTEADFTNHFFFLSLNSQGFSPSLHHQWLIKRRKKKYPNVSLAQGKPIPCVSSSNAHPLKKAKPCRKEGGLSCGFFFFLCVAVGGFFLLFFSILFLNLSFILWSCSVPSYILAHLLSFAPMLSPLINFLLRLPFDSNFQFKFFIQNEFVCLLNLRAH